MRTKEASKSKSSVLDTSLTELAFIFFFILLLVSVWKLNEQEAKLSELESQNLRHQKIIASTEAVSELIEKIKEEFGEASFDEFFTEIAKLKEQAEKVEILETILKEKETQLSFYEEEIEAIFKDGDTNKLIEQITEIAKIKEMLSEAAPEEKTAEKALKQILIERNDAIGQNNNLRQQIVRLGNGLVHPPCWADAQTGAVEFMFDVTILEDGVVFARGWPDSRNEQAMVDPTIQSVIGEYNLNSEHLIKTRPIFNQSVENGCRHFVQVSDKAISKDAFKKHLLAIEQHFYKRLTEVKYDG